LPFDPFFKFDIAQGFATTLETGQVVFHF
jgi:hypothetical protein